MLYDCKTNNQSQKRCTMDSFKEKDKLALYRSRRGADASDDRQRVPMDSKVNNGILNGLIQRSKHTRFTTI